MKKLKKIFTYNPYPDFTTREELAKKLQCQVNVIDNWFQNSRARLPTKESSRLFATWKQCNVPVQAHPLLEVQDTQAEAPNYTTNQSLSCAQKILMGRADCSSLEKQGISSQQAGPSWSFPVSGTIKQPGGALENQDHTGSGRSPSCPFPSYSPAGCLHTPKALVCYFVRERVDTGESQHADPFLSCYLHSEYGVRKQQEEQEEDNFKKCSLSECLQQDDWQYYLEQHQRPQIYQEKMLFLEQLTVDLDPGDQGQDLDSSQLQLQVQFPQNNGEPGCSQLQQAPPQIVANSSLLSPGQHMQQWASDQPRAQMQQPPLLSPGQRIQQGASYQPRAEMQQPPLLSPEQRMQQGASYQPTAQMQQPPLLSPGQCMRQEISHQPRAEMQQPPLLSPGKRMQQEAAYQPRAEMQQPPLLPPEQRMQQGTSYQPMAQMQQPPLPSPGQCMQQEISHQPRAEMQQPPLLSPGQRMQQGASYQPTAQMQHPPLLSPGQCMQQEISHQPSTEMQQPPLLSPGKRMQQEIAYQPRAEMQQPPLLPPEQCMQQGTSYQPRAEMQQPPLLPPEQRMQQGTSYQPRAQMQQSPLLPPGQLMQQGTSYQPTAQMQQPPLLPPR
ncbi:pro-neuregulin-4, membrane-bound isoform isoform X1 [Nycticebus coucang]|uniref:pro-neuregulin-4, membrane-bound isoform isoform X1 n=1 Tax=Nycticebus coucang TaxID=9470 RepID=UPI00234D6A40|nr:pro-neuregulin-4, membrane-bound isoform isoform X1 [Nycticebus coucang]